MPVLMESSVFLSETVTSFTSTMLYGVEYELLLTYFFIYFLVDLALASPLYALLITYAVDLLVRNARYYYGRAEVSAKAMLDARFLVE